MKHVHVNDVFTLMNRGRSSERNQIQFNSSLRGFDNMSVQRMKQLNRAARSIRMRREAEEMNEGDEVELGMRQMPMFTEAELEEEMIRMGPKRKCRGMLEQDLKVHWRRCSLCKS